MKQNSRGIPSLDGLRAISIIMVLISHVSVNIYHSYSTSFTRIQSIIQILFLVGHLGVTIFFVISGFLITTLLLKEERINLRKFYFRRTLRIFPPYYFYLLVILVLGITGIINLSSYNFLASLSYTRNYFFDDFAPDSWLLAHTWSLSVEEQFYLLIPGIFFLVGRKSGLTAIGLVIIICPILRLLHVLYSPETPVEFIRFETVADSLAVGCLLAGMRKWLHNQKWYVSIVHSNILLISPLLILFITCWGHFPKYYNKIFFVLVVITIQNIFIALFLDWAVTNCDGKIGKLLNTPLVAFLGIISYSVYLWQQPFLNPELDLPIPIKLLLILFASLCSYYLIEKPSLKFRGYLENKDYFSKAFNKNKTIEK